MKAIICDQCKWQREDSKELQWYVVVDFLLKTLMFCSTRCIIKYFSSKEDKDNE